MQQSNSSRWRSFVHRLTPVTGRCGAYFRVAKAALRLLWRWLDEKPTQASVAISLLAITFLGVIPDYYTLEARIPPPEQLKRSVGTLEFARGNKTGVRTFLHTAEGRRAFTCADPSGRIATCLADEKPYAGRRAVIWWFDMPSYPFFTRPYVVRMDVEGSTVLSYSESQDWLQRKQKPRWLNTWLAVAIYGSMTFVTHLFQRWKRSKGL